jgi:hypothetical protein
MDEALKSIKADAERILRQHGINDVTYQAGYVNIDGQTVLKVELLGPPASVAKGKEILGIRD